MTVFYLALVFYLFSFFLLYFLEDQDFDSGSKYWGPLLWLQQMKAIMLKRFYHARRSRKGFFSQILLPAIFVVLSMFVSLIRPPREGLPPLEMSPKMFGSPNYIVLNNRDVNQFSERFFKHLAKNPSSGM